MNLYNGRHVYHCVQRVCLQKRSSSENLSRADLSLSCPVVGRCRVVVCCVFVAAQSETALTSPSFSDVTERNIIAITLPSVRTCIFLSRFACSHGDFFAVQRALSRWQGPPILVLDRSHTRKRATEEGKDPYRHGKADAVFSYGFSSLRSPGYPDMISLLVQIFFLSPLSDRPIDLLISSAAGQTAELHAEGRTERPRHALLLSSSIEIPLSSYQATPAEGLHACHVGVTTVQGGTSLLVTLAQVQPSIDRVAPVGGANVSSFIQGGKICTLCKQKRGESPWTTRRRRLSFFLISTRRVP